MFLVFCQGLNKNMVGLLVTERSWYMHMLQLQCPRKYLQLLALKEQILLLTIMGQAALVAVDYKWSFRGLERGMPEYRAMREIVDARAAQRLLEVCRCDTHPGY